MSCTGKMWCPGGSVEATFTASAPCKFKRQLCVTCLSTNNVVQMRVQTNSFPNHCFEGVSTPPKVQEVDFTVNFNSDVRTLNNYPANSIDTSDKVNAALCQ